jgi:hypothetical protein
VDTKTTTAAGWTTEETELAREWGRRAIAAQHAHYFLATRLHRRNLALGLPVVIVTAVVGTSVFATLSAAEGQISPGLRVLVGSLSLLAAVLAAMQTFLRFAERSERHTQAGDWYSAIRREIEELLALPPEKRGDPKKALDLLRKELNKAGQIYPEIGEETWHRVAQQYGVAQPTFQSEAPGHAPRGSLSR